MPKSKTLGSADEDECFEQPASRHKSKAKVMNDMGYFIGSD